MQRLRRGLQGRATFDSFDLARATSLEGVLCDVRSSTARASCVAGAGLGGMGVVWCPTQKHCLEGVLCNVESTSQMHDAWFEAG